MQYCLCSMLEVPASPSCLARHVRGGGACSAPQIHLHVQGVLPPHRPCSCPAPATMPCCKKPELMPRPALPTQLAAVLYSCSHVVKRHAYLARVLHIGNRVWAGDSQCCHVNDGGVPALEAECVTCWLNTG
jgi:hypothetical protein